MTGVGRREVLAAGLGLVGFLWLRDDQEESEAGLIFESGDQPVRWESLSPVSGGVAVTVDGQGYGTLAGGVETVDGEPAAVTNRHVVDPEYPDGDDDVIGTPVYQPSTDGEPIGEVVDVGRSKGSGSTDWAVLSIDADLWTSDVLGLGSPVDVDDVEPGDRLVMSGLTTGLLGAEVTDVGVSRNWRGTLLEDVIEYRVDEDRDTAGNSGSWVGTIDESGEFRPVGLHTFAIDEYRYAVPVDDVLEDGDVEVVDGGEQPDASDVGSFVEGVVGEIAETATVVVANIGGDPAEDREIVLRDPEGAVVDAETVTLEPLERAVLSLDTGDVDRLTLDTGDVETEVFR